MVLMGNPKQGVEYLREALRADDQNVNAYVYLGLAKQSISETEPGMRLGSSDLIEAAWAYSRALELAPDMTDASSVTKYLGMVLELLGRHEEAVSWLEKGIERDPTNHDLLYTLARNLDSVGRIEEAITAYRETAKIKNSAMVHGRLCSLKKYTTGDKDFQEMEDLLEMETDTKKAAYLGFALGKAYGDIKNYDSAFHHLEQANRRMSQVFVTAGSGNSIESARERAHNMRQAFKSDPIHDHPLYFASATPIFIVGLPRSGSTLVEKILSSHSDVSAGGEDTAFIENAKEMQGHFAGAVTEVERHAIAQSAGVRYIADMKHRVGFNTSFFTDKMLENFWQIGLIRLMIPGAKVVHILRNPLDTCWSNFKQPLEGGLAMFASNLTNCADYYRIHKDIMLHWSKILPRSSILELRYEDLVQNQLEKTSELLEFIGLPWEDEVMSFHRTPGSVVTASVAQVRKPLYKSGIGQWVPYRAHLTEFLEQMEPLSQWGLIQEPGARQVGGHGHSEL